jgi:hypothetical protein
MDSEPLARLASPASIWLGRRKILPHGGRGALLERFLMAALQAAFPLSGLGCNEIEECAEKRPRPSGALRETESPRA